MTHSAPTLSPSVLVLSKFKSDKDFIPNIKQFTYARGAMIAAIHSIAKNRGFDAYPKVWAPAYVCDTVFYLLDAYKIPYDFYPITKNLTPDWEKIEELDTKEDEIFLLVYFFGFMMGVDETKSFCAKKNMILIEDCAHSIVSEIVPGGIGTHGEAAVFGLRKALPLPHGGFLYMKDSEISLPETLYESPGLYRSTLKMAIQWMIQKLRLPIKSYRTSLSKTSYDTFPENYNFFNYTQDIGSGIRKLINTFDIDDVIAKRRRNFKVYFDELGNCEGMEIPCTLHLDDPHTVPWIFYFFIDSAEELINWLRQEGVPASDFPNLYPTVFQSDDFELENDLYKRSVAMPVHQDLSVKKIKFMASKIREYIELNLSKGA